MPDPSANEPNSIRVGVYVDGFNLYYGARDHCGKGLPGWRWLDIESFVNRKMQERQKWQDFEISRIVFCTAERPNDHDVTSRNDQDRYINALSANSKIEISYGQFIPKVTSGALGKSRRKPEKFKFLYVDPDYVNDWLPHRIKKDAEGLHRLIVDIKTFEEKGSDVNVASHLLIDIYEKKIDAAIVVSNDGDLQFALHHARTLVPVGLINPGTKFTVNLLMEPHDPNSLNWWATATPDDYVNCQFPNFVGDLEKPSGW